MTAKLMDARSIAAVFHGSFSVRTDRHRVSSRRSEAFPGPVSDRTCVAPGGSQIGEQISDYYAMTWAILFMPKAPAQGKHAGAFEDGQ